MWWLGGAAIVVFVLFVIAALAGPSGFEAMGHPVPEKRLTAGYRAVKDMIPATTEDAMTLVGRVA